MERKVWRALTDSVPPATCTASPMINLPEWTGVTVDEPILMDHYHSKPTVHIRVHFWCTLYGFGNTHNDMQNFPGDSVVKNPPAVQETRVQSLGGEDPLEKETL